MTQGSTRQIVSVVRKYFLMRIVNRFVELDLLERLFPVCAHCQHMGFPLNIPLITRRFGEQLSVVDYRAKLKCVKCGSKQVHINLVSNMDRPDLDVSRQVYYSDDLRTAGQFKKHGNILPFAGYVS